MEIKIEAAINQNYIIGKSYCPGILSGETYHFDELIKTAIDNSFITLSSKKNFFIYDLNGELKLHGQAANG